LGAVDAKTSHAVDSFFDFNSAGGHLVALLGTTGNVEAFETGENLEASSKAQKTFLKQHLKPTSSR